MTKLKKKIKQEVMPTDDESKLKEAADKLTDTAKEAKEKFKDADPATKKKILAGVAGATAAIAAAIGIKKARE